MPSPWPNPSGHPAAGRIGYWLIGLTFPRTHHTWLHARPIKLPTGNAEAPRVDVPRFCDLLTHRASTPSNVSSTGSNNTEPSPPTTNSPLHRHYPRHCQRRMSQTTFITGPEGTITRLLERQRRSESSNDISGGFGCFPSHSFLETCTDRGEQPLD